MVCRSNSQGIKAIESWNAEWPYLNITRVYDYEPPSQLPPSMRAHHGVSKGGQGPATGLSKKAKASKVANVDSTFKVPLVPAPNSSQQKINKRNKQGETALHVACRLLKFFKAQELLTGMATDNFMVLFKFLFQPQRYCVFGLNKSLA